MTDNKGTRRQLVSSLGALGGVAVAASVPQKAGAQQAIKSKQGSWFAEFTTPDGRIFRGFSTFTPNGGMLTTGQNDLRRDAPQATGHGAWVQDGRKVDAKTIKFVFDADGMLTAVKEEFSSGELDDSGDLFVGTTTVYVYDLEGKLVNTLTGTIRATLVRILRSTTTTKVRALPCRSQIHASPLPPASSNRAKSVHFFRRSHEPLTSVARAAGIPYKNSATFGFGVSPDRVEGADPQERRGSW